MWTAGRMEEVEARSARKILTLSFLWLYFHEQGLTEWLICSLMMAKTHLTDKQTCLNAFSLLNNSI